MTEQLQLTEWDQAYLLGVEQATHTIHAAIRGRIADLRACPKRDDCATLAHGAYLALDDALNALSTLKAKT